jgi:hypothetical protein
MAKVTYHDLERAAPYVKFHDVEFANGIPVEVADDKTEMLELLGRNRFFEVERNGEANTGQAPDPHLREDEADRLDEARQKGAEAWTQGRDRRAPPRWSGTAFGEAWLAGYDDAARH